MEWNSHRWAWLSGIEDSGTAREKLLNENTSYKGYRYAGSRGELLTEGNPRRRSKRRMNESKLRAVLRKEILSVLREELSKQKDKEVTHGLKRKSLATSMGFGGYGFTPHNTTNRAAARTRTGVAFGGPGFM